MHCSGVNLERKHYDRRHWRIGQVDASDLHARRLNAKEVLTPQRSETSHSQSQMEQSKSLEEIDVWEHPPWPRIELEGLSSPTPLQDDSTLDGAEAGNDFWSITGDFICRHHVEPRVKLYMPREESCLIPLKYIDVTRNTHTSLDVLLERMEKENYQMHGQASQDWFIVLNKRPLDRYAWSGETEEETNDLKTRQCMARCVEAYVWCIKTQSEAKVGHRETKAR